MNRIALFALAGIAAAASAQSVTLHFDADGDGLAGSVVAASDASWTVYATFTGFPAADAYFGGWVGSFDATGDGAASNLVNLMGGAGTAAAASGADINNINIFNSALLGTDDQSNPLAIFSFDTAGTATELSYDASGIASMFADSGIFGTPIETQYSVVSDRLVVPAPGAAAVLGLGGLVATRRRR